MTLEVWFAYVVATIVVLVIPGPTILSVISYSLTHGSKAKAPLVLAVALGDSTALALSLVGLGALLSGSSLWFLTIKWIGGLYLLYLGVRMIVSALRAEIHLSLAHHKIGQRVFLNTYLVTVFNPKGIIFFIAFLPQFINPVGNTVRQLWVLAVTFVVLATLNAALYAFFAERARQLLATPSTHRAFNIGGGVLLSVAGVWALSARLV